MKQLTFVVILASALALFASPFAAPAAAQPAAGSITVPINGTGDAGTFVGSFKLQRFAVVDNAVNAVGLLTGTLTDASGAVTSIVQTVSIPIVGAIESTCDILHLELGPLDLDLLGLQINLNKIVLDITAQSGPGNLLGNLLCRVAGLLDDPSGLSRLLNNILALLG